MAKYPGIQILYEIGSKKELAASYGVSERTLYRWLAKARQETGEKVAKPRRPRQSTLENFKGTRAELAKKYGVSERTVYRWLNKAKEKGADITSRAKASKYPGTDILNESGTNRQIGERYGVSETTIRRWKKRAAAGMPEEIYAPEDLPQEIYTPDQLPEEIFTTEELPEEITFDEEPEEPDQEGKTGTALMADLLNEYNQLNDDSQFNSLSEAEKISYLDAYIMYQSDQDRGQFYNSETHDFDYSPEYVSTLNIWGDEFETWLSREKSLEDFGTDWIPE